MSKLRNPLQGAKLLPLMKLLLAENFQLVPAAGTEAQPPQPPPQQGPQGAAEAAAVAAAAAAADGTPSTGGAPAVPPASPGQVLV
jgi:hypothetical protein